MLLRSCFRAFVLALLLFSYASDAAEASFGDESELKGVTVFCLRVADDDATARKAFLKYVAEKLPSIRFEDKAKPGDFVIDILKPKQATRFVRMGNVTNSIPIYRGTATVFQKQKNGKRVVANFKTENGDTEGNAKDFAKDFVKLYKKVNPA